MPKQYPREFRRPIVRLVAEQRGEYQAECAAIRSVGGEADNATPE
jgi:hypothetical protein